MKLGARSAVALVVAPLAVGAVIGLAIDGGSGAVRGFVAGFGTTMLAIAATMLVLALRSHRPGEDWSIVAAYSILRAGSGAAAIWLAAGGGAKAGWTLVAFIVAYPVWMTLMRHRRGTA